MKTESLQQRHPKADEMEQQAPLREPSPLEIAVEHVRTGTMTDADRLELIAAGLEFCPDCRALLVDYAHRGGRTFSQIVREVFWSWFGNWEHGHGCPPRP